MKIVLLADPSSIHTIRWANGLAGKGISVLVCGLNAFDENSYHKNVIVKSFALSKNIFQKPDGNFSKIVYLKIIPGLKKIIREYQPDILHAHYASSYGFIGALTNFHPFIVSVWGSDIFSFPTKSFLHEKIIKYTLHKSDRILSTSKIMAEKIKQYVNQNIDITPFGIDLELFKPKEVESIFTKEDIVIGTIKSLETKYGIDYLIKAFKILTDKYPTLPLKLLIVGGGTLEENLKEKVVELKISRNTIFTGSINHSEIPNYHNMIDVFVALSLEESESFGVSVIEASASGKPVVVTNIGGLPEVVEENVTGIIVKPSDEIDAAKGIEKLILNAQLRNQLGLQGRERVKTLYNWNENVKQMIEIYKDVNNNFSK